MHFIPEKNVILVTDTYNHKIKVVDPFRSEIFSWLGQGKTCLADETTFKAGFNEPSGISSLYDEEKRDVKVYVADTNNHCIRQVFYDSGLVTTPQISGVPRCAGGECVPQAAMDDSIDIEQKEVNSKMKEKPATDEAPNMECEDGNCKAPADWLDSDDDD